MEGKKVKKELFANKQEEDQEEVDDDEIEDMIEEGYNVGFDLGLYDAIRLNENDVRLFKRNETYLLPESDFESVFFNYNGELNEYEILNKIAEAHNIDSNNIVVMMTEGKVSDTNLVIKKAMNKYSEAINITNSNNRLKGQLARLEYEIDKISEDSKEYLQLQSEISRIKKLLK